MSTNNGDLYFFEKEYTNMDDIALVTNARQGDSIALNCIFEKYNDLLNAVVNSVGDDENE